MTNKAQTISIKLRIGRIGMTKSQLGTLDGLGLKKIGQIRTLEDTPCVRGMIKKVINFLDLV